MSDPTPPADAERPLRVGSRVEVRTGFDGSWASGYLVAAIDDRFGPVDVLVNNAGVALDGFNAGVARETIDVNFHGPRLVTAALLPLIRAMQGDLRPVPAEVDDLQRGRARISDHEEAHADEAAPRGVDRVRQREDARSGPRSVGVCQRERAEGVGGVRLAAPEFLLKRSCLQENAPASRAGVATTAAVGVDIQAVLIDHVVRIPFG